ncbi:AraC family transcriptional regulator [Stieleria varia]|uniref:Xylose operon regulatory protein n=1 Tax=Stieleria varia TaxID=2528005 RepID=A0A5C6A8T1_9BACT|nr:DNA-binding transcriptional regulator [Stieleria varia]TWT94693.1 Xylose operon regulatory protein [Stieleria varia]
MPASGHRIRQVGILVETDDSWGRNVVESVCRAARNNGWTVLIAPRDAQGRLRLPKVWKGDGIIASLRTTSLTRHVKQLKLPVVDVSAMVPKQSWFARVATDDNARARFAFDHLRNHGIANFACYAPPIGRYSDVRSESFVRTVTREGFQCALYQTDSDDQSGWLTNHANVQRWLARLPRPLGVFAADPYPARQLIEICTLEGIRVPDDVAILSGDDDELLCNVASPQISAIELASHRIGETAATILSRMMDGATTPKRTKWIAPLRVRSRHSTEILAIGDEEIAEILRYIRDHATEGINVADLTRAFPISRRRLEQRFRLLLKRSPAVEIRRVRLEHACRLLLDTDRSVSSIATESGLASGASLSQAFRQYIGVTPLEYRQGKRTHGSSLKTAEAAEA